MLRFVLPLSLLAIFATPSMAQSYQGNWSCRDATSNRAGILTIYGQVYGWASRTMGDANSGTGTTVPYEDGIGINDGNLRANAGIRAGRVVADANFGVALQLETDQAIVMLCTPR